MKALFTLALVGISVSAVRAQSVAEGLRLYQVLNTGETGLVDELGQTVHLWQGSLRGLSAHIMDDGTLLRTGSTGLPMPGGVQGAIQRVTLDGRLLWDFRLDGPDAVQHHEIEIMPNGNVLLIAWDLMTAADAIAHGRDPALITGHEFYPDAVYEVRQTGRTSGEVVWEWHMWDHMVQEHDDSLPGYAEVRDHPELLDINFPAIELGNGDWNHFNGIEYDPIEDWIILSARSQSEIYIVDHSTTSEEAAGHTGGRRGRGGDFLYRWGNPQAYDRGSSSDQRLFNQHDPRVIPPGYPGAGHITVFNNNWGPGQSQVVEIALPRDSSGELLSPGNGMHGPDHPVWDFTAANFFSPFMSSAERLPNGNTLICSALQNTIFEVTPSGNQIWGRQIDHQGVAVFQSHHVKQSFWACDKLLSISRGGRVEFESIAGSGHAGEWCLILGSATGTSVGRFEGAVHVPLDYDFLYDFMIENYNRGSFLGTLQQLDQDGRGAAAMVIEPGAVSPDLVGLQLHFAHTLWDESFRVLRASNPVTVTLSR